MEHYIDSSNDMAQGSTWPLVRMVRMRSNRWTSLRTGARIVDAPGEDMVAAGVEQVLGRAGRCGRRQ